ncbi:MAG: sister chromatid cohesion protein PDS5 [Candidatus Helarchaeota archaeon]
MYFSEKENEAETPYHRIIRKIIRKIVEKVKGKSEAVIVFCVLFYLIPTLILFYGLKFDFLFSIFLVFMIYPLIIVIYFISYTIFRFLTSFLFLHNIKNVGFLVGIASIGTTILFEVSLIIQNSDLIFFSLLAFLGILIYGIVKELRYRPLELSHIIDDIMRPFEYVHGSFLLVGFGLFFFLANQLFKSVNFIMIPTGFASFIETLILIASFLLPIFLCMIILSKAKSHSRALVVALTRDSMKLNAAIKARYINDRTLIETIEKSINKGYIRPEYTPKLYRLLKNEDVHIRRKAIILLRKITEDDRFKSVSIVPHLLEFLKSDKIWTVRLEAAESLTQMMNILPQIEIKNVLKFLTELKPDKNRYVRWGIIKLLCSIALSREEAIEEILPFLLKGLEDDEWSVRKGTIESFNQLSENFPDYIPKMLEKSLKLLTDEDLDIIKEVFKIIQKITGIEVNSDNLQLLKDQISEKIGPEFSFDIKLLEQALERIKEMEKPAKFVFKKSALPRQ